MALILKSFYSVILIAVVIFTFRELYSVWFDDKLYIGKFNVIADAGQDEAAIGNFPKQVVAARSMLAQQIQDYQTRADADQQSDITFDVISDTNLSILKDNLGEVDVVVQEINITRLLAAIRRGFTSPNEVSGSLTVSEGSVMGAVDWPRGPVIEESADMRRFLLPNSSSQREAALHVACSVTWAQLNEKDSEMSGISRAQFCDFGSALHAFYALERGSAQTGSMGADNQKRVRYHVDRLRQHYSDAKVLPDLFRLRADLIELLPDRAAGALAEAQEDRLRYAYGMADLGTLDESERMKALALARPAYLLDDGVPLNVGENWKPLLEFRAAEIRRHSASVGILTGADGQAYGTGFVVAPGIIATAGYTIDALRSSSGRPQTGSLESLVSGSEAVPATLCFGEDGGCANPLRLGSVVWSEDDPQRSLALVEVFGHDPVENPPLQLVLPDEISEDKVGSFAYIIAYIFPDARMPSVFIDALIGEDFGRKRLLPGRVLAFGPTGQRGNFDELTTDISTSSGAGGGPLIDMNSGKVLGLHWAGRWQGERGKFAYSRPIPQGAIDFVRQLSRRSTDETD